jgi:hypothetical protein
MRLSSTKYLVMLGFVLATLPICAARTDTAPWAPTQPTIIGTAQVNPGNYRLRAEEELNELEVIQGSKVIATVPCYWKVLPKKAANTEINVNNSRVTEVQFRKRSESILFFP